MQAHYGAAGPGIKIGNGPTPSYMYSLAANEVFTRITVGFGSMNCGGSTVFGLCYFQPESNQRNFVATTVTCTSGGGTSTYQLSAGLAYLGGYTINGCITGLAFYHYI